MTPAELRAARERLALSRADLTKALRVSDAGSVRVARSILGLSQAALAQQLRLGKHGGRTVRSWELGEIPVPGPASVAIELLVEKAEKAETPNLIEELRL